eukprot:CAMPEP_0172528238 /NCGR_PEP_ID=MMETSP1067-20121228/2691_1 /TAXON_ID=265564 ORGANISM="Thalassiosira punctigera, Strain Tpunct2005C2" /NCGR_SAMPLE_ID=MMETSP1067 /ASSEMBLY_ACC=CAM_ASM_000444 /LENGTH=574 /DNA_ID=CAMNT_0013312117 /DNA_START=30 /DNA_END=1754 /DNA_ORIENTATION=+
MAKMDEMVASLGEYEDASDCSKNVYVKETTRAVVRGAEDDVRDEAQANDSLRFDPYCEVRDSPSSPKTLPREEVEICRRTVKHLELKATIARIYEKFAEDSSKGTVVEFGVLIDATSAAIFELADETPDPVYTIRVFQQHLWELAVKRNHYIISLAQPMENIDRRCFWQGQMLLRGPEKEVPDVLEITKEMKDELKELRKKNTFYGIGGAIFTAAIQLGLIRYSRSLSWIAGFCMALCPGSFVVCNLGMRIHDSSHDTEASTGLANRLVGVLCDCFVPTPGETFRFAQDHHYHHVKLGQPGEAGVMDNDLLSPDLANLVGRNAVRKFLLVILFPIAFGVDQGGLCAPESMTALLELATKVLFVTAVALLGGPRALAYWLVSGFVAHSANVLTSAHWTQEHGMSRPMFKFRDDLDEAYADIPRRRRRDAKDIGWSEVPVIQETRSFYPENFFRQQVTDRVGLHESWAAWMAGWYDGCVHRWVNYHNEHHLFTKVPSFNLPRLRALLRPYWDCQIHNDLGSDDVWDFIFNPDRCATFRTVRSGAVGRWWREHVNTSLVLSKTTRGDDDDDDDKKFK